MTTKEAYLKTTQVISGVSFSKTRGLTLYTKAGSLIFTRDNLKETPVHNPSDFIGMTLTEAKAFLNKS